MRNIFLTVLAVLFAAGVQAQILNPVKWSYAAKKVNAKEAIVFLKASMQPGWNIYSQHVAEGGPVATSFKFTTTKAFNLVGKTTEPKPQSKFEKTFGMNVTYFQNEVVFQQKIKLNENQALVKGTLEYMACNDKQCLPPKEVEFSILVK